MHGHHLEELHSGVEYVCDAVAWIKRYPPMPGLLQLGHFYNDRALCHTSISDCLYPRTLLRIGTVIGEWNSRLRYPICTRHCTILILLLHRTNLPNFCEQLGIHMVCLRGRVCWRSESRALDALLRIVGLLGCNHLDWLDVYFPSCN